jgi:hypothetical protein
MRNYYKILNDVTYFILFDTENKILSIKWTLSISHVMSGSPKESNNFKTFL